MKQEILKDESRFQRACSRYVERNVICCVSSLMYDIGQNLEACSKIFDFDYDEAIGWYQRDDWEEPVAWFIRKEATLEQLQEIAGEELESDDEATREKVLEGVEDYEEVGREYNLDPYVTEIYEHWSVNSWFAKELEAEGGVIFDFADFTVYGRMTTGQSLSLDGITRRIVRSLPDDHWIWND